MMLSNDINMQWKVVQPNFISKSDHLFCFLPQNEVVILNIGLIWNSLGFNWHSEAWVVLYENMIPG